MIDEATKLSVGLVLAALGVTAVLALLVLFGVASAPAATAGFIACGALAAVAVLMIVVRDRLIRE